TQGWADPGEEIVVTDLVDHDRVQRLGVVERPVPSPQKTGIGWSPVPVAMEQGRNPAQRPVPGSPGTVAERLPRHPGEQNAMAGAVVGVEGDDQSARRRGYWCRQVEVRVLGQLLEPGDFEIDVGSGVGFGPAYAEDEPS